jgi:peptide-methionine (S)-S-oxide reductase
MTDTAPTPHATAAHRVITLGGGCFWCTEAVFVRVKGHVLNPSYADVCTGETGHNEVVRLVYDPQVVSLRDVLEIFFVIHDPTTLNRQGNDVGTQYRSGIYWSDEDDRAVAQQVLDDVNQHLSGRVVTELLPLNNFSAAEDYHQDYFANHPNQGYCAFVVAPKVQKFLHTFADKVRDA